MQARPYAQMLLNVLESLVRRTDLYNEDTGEILHPLLVEREEKNVLVIVIAGDKGFAGGFNSNVGKAAQKFIDLRTAKGQNIDLEPVGKKAIGFYKRRFEAARYDKTEEHYDNDLSTHYETIRRSGEPDRSGGGARGYAAALELRGRGCDGALDHRALRTR